MPSQYQRMRNIVGGTLAAAASRDAYQYGKKILMGGKRQLTWKSRSKRASRYSKRARQSGGHMITSSPRTHTVTASKQLIDTRTLYQQAVNKVPKRDSSFQIGSRSRDIINCVGIRVTASFTNSLGDRVATDFASTGINIALVVPRDTSTGNVGANNFFRGDMNADRSYGFNTLRSFLELHNSPINADDYDVLWRDKRVLELYSGTNNWNLVKYIPYKRQLRFDELSEAHEVINLVWWCDDTRAGGGDPAQIDFCHAMVKTELIFHDVN